MPGFDRTGPMGYGPRTGRGFGPCGRGLGFRRGFGMGFVRGYSGYGPSAYAPTKEQEIADLNAEKEAIHQELREIEARLKELEKLEQHIDNTLAAHESATASLTTDMSAIKELLRVGFRLPEES